MSCLELLCFDGPNSQSILLIRCDWEIHRHLCGIALKGLQNPKPFSAFCAHSWVFLEHIFRRPCDCLPKLLKSRREDRVKFMEIHKKFLKLWSAVFYKFFVNTLDKIITQYRWMATSLFIVDICSTIFEHSTSLPYSSFTHYILAVNRA
jgi:hypothetical protein